MGMEQSVLSAIQAAPKNIPTDIMVSDDFQSRAKSGMNKISLERPGVTADTLAVKRGTETLISTGLANFVNNARNQQTRSM